jgi:hypothetical protein
VIYFNGWFSLPAAVFQRVMEMLDACPKVTGYRDNALRLLPHLK